MMKTEKNILIAFLLNISFCIIEFFGGLFSHSIAILSDSLHDFGDALSIGVSFFLEKKSKHKPDDKHTYGYVRYSVLGSIITTVILLVGSVFVIVESVSQLNSFSYDAWYKRQIQGTDGLWIGDGVADQYT